MGVHYFYTWITRRYPLFKKQFSPQVMPNIDNFYIDLNGVLYRCAKDDGAIFKDILNGKGFDEIFRAVTNYINYLVNHMKPNKRIFIAVDGVAPRAKMNNQRQRRYHSAKSNKDMNDFLVNTLQTEPGVISYKNNSISPGTEFMMTLIEHL
jgi:5'-3' exoribonuclease 1